MTRQEAEQALTSSPPTPPPEPPTPNAELVAIEITWDGVGALYKAFFQDQKRITQLSKDLAPWLEEPVQLFIHYDSEDFLGQIVVRVPPDGLRIQPRFDPSSGSLPEGQVMLSDLAPITTALATYRSGLSQSYDVRIQSFVIAIDFYRGPVHCRFGATGDPPPDGTLVSPCPLINGQEVCGLPETHGVKFTGDALDKLRTCLN